jgi:hypothetical protein
MLLIGSLADAAHCASFPYVSCVGNEWSPLKLQSVSGENICVGNDVTKVCRVSIDEASNATSRVTVTQHGRVLVDWLESGDPSALDKTLAFSSRGGELVVATLQSESQGMALRDWNVTYISPSDSNIPYILHASSSEFGSQGAIVKNGRSSPPYCALLVTEWQTRQTRSGARLFLNAYLRPLSASQFELPGNVIASVRFDDRIKKLREEDGADMPLSLFR